MPLPASLQFELKPFSDESFARMQASVDSLKQLQLKAGTTNDKFRVTATRIRRSVLESQSPLADEIRDQHDLRVAMHLLATDRVFAQAAHIDDRFYAGVDVIQRPLSRMTLFKLIRAFFMHFDEMTGREGITALCTYLQRQLNETDAKSRGNTDLGLYHLLSDTLFTPRGPLEIVNAARSNQTDLAGAVKAFSLKAFSAGRYLALANAFHYLQRLESLPVGADDPILAEIANKEVNTTPFRQGLLGHEFVRVLIDRTGAGPISAPWRRAVLAIAGDPRTSRATHATHTWWKLLGRQREERFRSWLSAIDVRLFLKVLRQSIEEENDDEKLRMFVDRQAFLSNLVDSGLVIDSRVFLGAAADQYMRALSDVGRHPPYATLSTKHTSAIYLNLAGRAHLIEGTHQFRLTLMRQLPTASQILNPHFLNFEDRDVRSGLVKLYRAEFGDEGYQQFTHRGTNWIPRALTFLETCGIRPQSEQ